MPAKSEIVLQLADRVRTRAGANIVKPPDTVYEWARRYRMPDAREFSLKRYVPLQALYEDDWQRIVVMKPAQRGVSEWAINLACFALEYGARKWGPIDLVCQAEGCGTICKTDELCEACGGKNIKEVPVKSGVNVAIIFPARGDLIDFSKERLSNLKDETTHLAAMFAGEEFDSLGFKQVGDSFLYLRGGYSEAGLRSFPCDILILDEYDQLDASAVSLARRRLNASLIKREIRISTPTIPGVGISAAYASTDMRVYQTKCKSCKEWVSYDFFTDVLCDGEAYDEWKQWSQPHVEQARVTLHCPNCKTEQSQEDRCTPGRWIVTAPEVTRVHGYHIPWWPWEFIDLDALAASAVSTDTTEQEEFFRSDLGLAHGVGGGQITEEMLMQCTALMPPEGLPAGPWRDTVLGADIGARIHYSIDSIGPDNATYVRAMGSVGSWEELDKLMSTYQVRQAVIDAEPELLTALSFCERWKGRALRCFYPTTANALKTTMFVQKEGTCDVQANRNVLLDTVFTGIANATERWPKEIASDPEVVALMGGTARVMVTDEKTGQQRYNWLKTGPDHLMHARGYAVLARRTLPPTTSFAPAVSGDRPVIQDYQRIAFHDQGRAGFGQAIPPWIPPAVR